MRAVGRASAAAVVLALIGSCTGSRPPTDDVVESAGHPADPVGNHLVGYFTGWGIYRQNYRVKDVHISGTAGKLTHLVYAFGTVDEGRCVAADNWADFQRSVSASDSVDGVADGKNQAVRGSFNQLRELKKMYPQLKILWSFGGWTGSGGFTAAAKDPATFATSCYDLVEDPRWADVFDGIDVDWEYPNACGRTCDTSGPEALTALVTALRARFGDTALVTATITGDGAAGGIGDAADYPGAAPALDWVMAMTYDYFGTGSTPGPTAPHSALYPYPGIPRTGSSAQETIAKLVQRGIPERKLLLGIGFYGRGWTGVTQAEPGGTATGPAPGTYESGIDDYAVLAQRCPPTGTVGGTAYAFCPGQWWSYDTPATAADKARYARDQGLGGVFVWELSGDTPDGDLISAIRAGLG